MSIDECPSIIDSRTRIGDWEGDTVIGKGRKYTLMTLIERKTLLTVVRRIESKHAELTVDTIISCMTRLRDEVFTITFDNGKEFAQHERIYEQFKSDIYFAHPYSS